MAKTRSKSIRAKSTSLRGRKTRSHLLKDLTAHRLGNFVVPLAISGVLLACLGFIGFLGYRTATASGFFVLKNIDVRGTVRTSADDIRRVVAASVEKPGVWNADLADVRAKIEKFPFVKAAAVSMVLPAGIRVNVTERIPAAIVHLKSGEFFVDAEGAVLSAAQVNDKDFPFVLQGWDEAKTEKAMPDNLARLKVYRKMLDEWKQYDLASRVKEVNLANPREPVAVVEDSGSAITVALAGKDLGKSLRMAIEAVSGKGAKVRSVDAGGIYPVLQYRD